MRKSFFQLGKIIIPTLLGLQYGRKIILAQSQPPIQQPHIDINQQKLQNIIIPNQNQQQPKEDLKQQNKDKQIQQEQEYKNQILQQIINIQNQRQKQEQKKEIEKEEIKQQQQKQQQKQLKKQQKQKQKQQQKQQQMLEILQNNCVAVPQNYSQQIIKYLQKCGYQIHKTKKQECLRIKNKIGHQRIFQTLNTDDQFFKLTNFMNPPYFIRSQNKQLLRQMLSIVKNDQHMIVTYLPDDYKLQPKNIFDTFTPKKQKNIQQLQNNFIENKYNSGSSKNLYIIIKDKQIANILKIGNNKIGQIYIYSKSSQKTFKDATTMIEGQRFYVQNPKIYQNSNLKIDFYSHSILNQINIDSDMENFLRKMRISNDQRKILLVSSKQRRPQFLKNVNDILFKVGKLMDKQAIVITTSNQKILKKYFKIIPDQFVTIRLINIHQKQQPIFVTQHKSQKSQQANIFYSRKVMSAPFTVQNLCQFIQKPSKKQYYEKNKNLSKIQSIIDTQIPHLQDTLLLYQKYGCSGCKYTKQILERLIDIMNNLEQSNIFQYQIYNAELLPVSIKSINILNQSEKRINTSQNDVTPRLEYHDKEYVKVININKILQKLNSLGRKNQEQIHKQIIRDIIQEILSVKRFKKLSQQ